MNKYAIWGLGEMGKTTFDEIGSESVGCFIDNDPRKCGLMVNNTIPVIGFQEYLSSGREEMILLPMSSYYYDVRNQLIEHGINKWKIYQTKGAIGNEKELIINPYKNTKGLSYDYNQSYEIRTMINDYAKQLFVEQKRFDCIEIETYNRCNGVCEFCPVSVKNESREEMLMTEELFKKIIDELQELNYDGKIALFSNNEPFLDGRIIEFQKYARNRLPKAFFYLYTNGTVFTLNKFIEIVDYLDEIFIDNYNQNLDLIPNVKRIVEYCEEHIELKSKVTVMLRKPKEVLTNRGGDAPNSSICEGKFGKDSCVLPFRQLVIRPDGKVSLCCNDPLGKYTLGDLSCEKIIDVWYGEKYRKLREKIVLGRENIDKCKGCDTVIF